MSQVATVPANRWVGLLPTNESAQVTNSSSEYDIQLDNGETLKAGESGYFDGPLSATASFDAPVFVDETAEKPKAKAKSSTKKSSTKSRSK